MPYFFRFSLSSGPVLPVVLTLVALTHTFPHLSLATWRHGPGTWHLPWPGRSLITNTGLIFTQEPKSGFLKVCVSIHLLLSFSRPFLKIFLIDFISKASIIHVFIFFYLLKTECVRVRLLRINSKQCIVRPTDRNTKDGYIGFKIKLDFPFMEQGGATFNRKYIWI